MSRTPLHFYPLRALLALALAVWLGLGCLSNPTPHPQREPGSPTTDHGADDASGAGDDALGENQDDSGFEGPPPCTPDAGGDVGASDVHDGELWAAPDGGVVAWEADCGPLEGELDAAEVDTERLDVAVDPEAEDP